MVSPSDYMTTCITLQMFMLTVLQANDVLVLQLCGLLKSKTRKWL